MPQTEGQVRGCKTFFFNTLSISDKMVTTVQRKTQNFGIGEKDKRGRHAIRPS